MPAEGGADRRSCEEFFNKYPVTNKGFAKFHDADDTQEICINTTEEQEQAIIDAARAYGGAGPFGCSIAVGNVLRNSGVFPNFDQFNTLPGNLDFPSDKKVIRDGIIDISK